MPKIALIHFNPLELYPPVMNWLHYLAGRPAEGLEVEVFTTHATQKAMAFASPAPFIRIVRIGATPEPSSARRYLTYLRFFTGVTRRLATWRPDGVLYYETFSSFPALFYKRLLRPSCRLFVHYHEYMSVEEYRKGMALNRLFHRWEQRIYPRTAWVSHTNEDRMRHFLEDHRGITIPHTFVMPNYPPAGWTIRTPKPLGHPLRIVYLGALGFEAMYLAEFAEWVLSQKGRVVWDIYSVNITPAAREYLDKMDKDLIRFRGECDYYDIPGIIAGADIGVVLYKGITPNHIMAVSNKVFEYLACGLDVWYSGEMTGTDPYRTAGVYPKVLRIDWRAMHRFDLDAALDRNGLAFRPSPYHYEQVYDRLYNAMSVK